MRMRENQKKNRLRELRVKKNMPQQQLAVSAGTSLSTIVGVERYGYYPARNDLRKRIAEALGVNENEIWNVTRKDNVL